MILKKVMKISLFQNPKSKVTKIKKTGKTY